MTQATPQAIRIVVTDANILINLIHVDRLDLLAKLPGYEFVVPKGLLFPEYLYYFMCTVDAGNLVPSHDYPSLRLSDIEQIGVPLPPPPVQAAIVSILQKADSIRRKRAEARQLQMSLQSALFKQMFSRSPKKITPTRLGTLLKERPRYGSSLLANSLGQGVPVLRIPNVLSGEFDLTDIKYIQDLPAKAGETLAVKAGDLLLVRTNGNRTYVGRCAVAPELDRPFVFASYLIRLRPDLSRAHPLFLDAFLKTEDARNQMLRGIPTSAGNYNINAATLSNLEIPLPKLEDQQRFAYVVAQINTASARLTTAETLADACWNVLLDRAFTGDLVA